MGSCQAREASVAQHDGHNKQLLPSHSAAYANGNANGGAMFHSTEDSLHLPAEAKDGRVERLSHDGCIYKPIFPHHQEIPFPIRLREWKRVAPLLPLANNETCRARRHELLQLWSRLPSSSSPSNKTVASSSSETNTISLAEVDRGSRCTPWLMQQVSSNMCSIWQRGFNAVKCFLQKGNDVDELLDAREFHMLLLFVAYYLDALTIVDPENFGELDHPSLDDEFVKQESDYADEEALLHRDDELTGGRLKPSMSASLPFGVFRVTRGHYVEHVLPCIVSARLDENEDPTCPANISARSAPPYFLRWSSRDCVPPSFRVILNADALFPEVNALVVCGKNDSALRSGDRRHHHHPDRSPPMEQTALAFRDEAPSEELCDVLSRSMLSTVLHHGSSPPGCSPYS